MKKFNLKYFLFIWAFGFLLTPLVISTSSYACEVSITSFILGECPNESDIPDTHYEAILNVDDFSNFLGIYLTYVDKTSFITRYKAFLSHSFSEQPTQTNLSLRASKDLYSWWLFDVFADLGIGYSYYEYVEEGYSSDFSRGDTFALLSAGIQSRGIFFGSFAFTSYNVIDSLTYDNKDDPYSNAYDFWVVEFGFGLKLIE